MTNLTDYLNCTLDFAAPETVSIYDELPLWSAKFGLLLLKYIPEEHEKIFTRLEMAVNDLNKGNVGLNLTIPMAYVEGGKVQ